MNRSSSANDFPEERSGFDSLNCAIFISDGPGDPTVKSPSPLLLQLGRAEQERLARWEQLGGPTLPPAAPAEDS